jgi:hypothetical protein
VAAYLPFLKPLLLLQLLLLQMRLRTHSFPLNPRNHQQLWCSQAAQPYVQPPTSTITKAGCCYSLQLQPAATACSYSLQLQPAATAC